MTELDAKLIPVVLWLLKKFGKKVTFTAPPPSTNIIASKASGPQQRWPVTITPPEEWTDTRPQQGTQGQGSGSTKGVKCYIAGADQPFSEPTKFMRVNIDGQEWKIEEIDRIYSGELVALYVLKMKA